MKEIGFVSYFVFVAGWFLMTWVSFLLGKAKRQSPQATEKDRQIGFRFYCMAIMSFAFGLLLLGVGVFALVISWIYPQ